KDVIGDMTGYTSASLKPFSVKQIEIVPEVSSTLFSVWQFLNEGYDVWFDHKKMSMNMGQLDTSVENVMEVTGSGNWGIFHLSLRCEGPEEKALLGAGLPSCEDAHLWHAWYMHTGYHHLEGTRKGVHGMKIDGEIPRDIHCEACIIGKMHICPH